MPKTESAHLVSASSDQNEASLKKHIAFRVRSFDIINVDAGVLLFALESSIPSAAYVVSCKNQLTPLILYTKLFEFKRNIPWYPEYIIQAVTVRRKGIGHYQCTKNFHNRCRGCFAPFIILCREIKSGV